MVQTPLVQVQAKLIAEHIEEVKGDICLPNHYFSRFYRCKLVFRTYGPAACPDNGRAKKVTLLHSTCRE